MQSEFYHSRKMQIQFRDDRPEPSILYHTKLVRHCLGTIDLTPNSTVVPQPIKYLHCFSKYTLFTLQSIKYLHGNSFSKDTVFQISFQQHCMLGRNLGGLGSSSGF